MNAPVLAGTCEPGKLAGMRTLALLLALATPLAARADCKEEPGQASADRSLSDAPYAGPAKPPPCRTSPEPPGLAHNDGWTAERDPARMEVAELGTVLITLGALALVTGGGFAICAHNDSVDKTRKFCSDAEAPTLIGGAVSAGLGLGALSVSTFVLREEDHRGHASLAAGLSLRLALDLR